MGRFFYAFLLFFAIFKSGSASGLCDYFENTSVNVSEPCLKQMRTVCNDWALTWKFFDATSRIFTSGINYSNVFDYGNFPECLSIKYEDANGQILGKFCGLSHLIVDFFLTPETEKILTKFGLDTNATDPQIISKETFTLLDRNVRDLIFTDVPYVLSKYSSCVPDACTPREVGNYYFYGRIFANVLPLLIYTDLEPCETANSNIDDFEPGDIGVIFFFSLIGVLLIASTLYDALLQNFKKEPYHPLLLAFSVLRNGKMLLHVSDDTTEQIQCFNGMRFISMMWVVAYHGVTVYQPGIIGLENYPEVLQWSNNVSSQYILSGLLAVDTFFYIAGFLLAFTYLKRSTEEPALLQVLKVPKMYLHRYLRLTPAVGAMYLVIISIFRFFGKGPNWSLVTGFFKQLCKDKWWEFFLYVQNYTDPDNMCVIPTWYLSADMQMFILAPLVMIPTAMYVKKKFKLVMVSIGALAVLSIVVTMIVRFVNDDIGNTYSSHERFNNFLIGIAFGAYMRFYKHKPFIFKPIVNVLIWTVILVVSLAFNLYWFDILTYTTVTKYTLFNAFYRPIWCLSLSYMVYACYHNQGGIVQWILTRPSFQVLGRLSYCMYVLHYLVEIFAGGTLKTTTYFSNYFLFYNWCGHLIVTLIVSLIWVLAFEYPMLTIDKYLLGDDKWTKELYVYLNKRMSRQKQENVQNGSNK